MGDQVPDLDTVLKMWAWTAYLRAKGESQFEYEDIQLKVVWDKVACETRNPHYSNGKFNSDPSPLVLRAATFENNSDETQEHNFPATGQTTSFATTDLTQGILRSAGFKMALPPEVQPTFGQEMVLSEDGHITRRTQTWNSETKIEAAPRKKTQAKLVVVQKSYECDFTCELRLKGTVLVNIVNRQTGSLLMTVQNDLTTVLKDIIHADEESGEYLGVHFEGETAVWSSAGHLHFLYGVGEKVEVERENLPADKD